MSLPNFSLQETGVSVPAGTASAATSIPLLGGQIPEDILIYNPDPTNIAYVRTGKSTVTANTSCMPILPGEKSTWSVRGATHIATIRAAGSTALLVFAGRGN